MFEKPFQHTVSTHIRLLLKEQSDQGPHCLSRYLTLLNNVSKNLQPTEFSDDFFAGILRVNVAEIIRFCY